jgi:hypothetical protein
MGVELAAIAIGLLWGIRCGNGWPFVFFVACAIGWGYVTARSTPWGDAKALMIVSPAVIAAAMLGPASLWRTKWRPAAIVLAAAITFGLLWTNALAYHGVDLAPRDRLSELGTIGHRFAGQGPTLYTEFEEFSKHFLHEENPSGSDEAWQDNPRATLADGAGTRFGFSTDIDQLAQSYVQHFRTLVLRRSGSASRPPSDYRLAYSGRFYDVWQKTNVQVLAHLALGDTVQPAAVPPCPRIGTLAGRGATRLAYVERPQLPVLFPAQARRPRFWTPDGTDPTNLRPYGAGTLTGAIDVPQGGRYTVWVQGSFGRPVTVSIDGRRVGKVQHELNPRGQSDVAGQVSLGPGRHTILVVRPSGNLYPGDGGRNRLLGPIVLDPASDTRTVRELPATRWHDLCGRRLDWVEAIR